MGFCISKPKLNSDVNVEEINENNKENEVFEFSIENKFKLPYKQFNENLKTNSDNTNNKKEKNNIRNQNLENLVHFSNFGNKKSSMTTTLIQNNLKDLNLNNNNENNNENNNNENNNDENNKENNKENNNENENEN